MSREQARSKSERSKLPAPGSIVSFSIFLAFDLQNLLSIASLSDSPAGLKLSTTTHRSRSSDGRSGRRVPKTLCNCADNSGGASRSGSETAGPSVFEGIAHEGSTAYDCWCARCGVGCDPRRGGDFWLSCRGNYGALPPVWPRAAEATSWPRADVELLLRHSGRPAARTHRSAVPGHGRTWTATVLLDLVSAWNGRSSADSPLQRRTPSGAIGFGNDHLAGNIPVVAVAGLAVADFDQDGALRYRRAHQGIPDFGGGVLGRRAAESPEGYC